MTKQLSLRMRLTVWYTAVLTLGLILFSFTVWLALSRLLHSYLTTSLADQTQGFEEYLHIEEQDPAVDLIREMGEYSQALPQEHLLAVYDASGQLIYSNNAAGAHALARSQGLTGPGESHELGWRQQHFLALSRSIRLQRGTIHVFLAITSDSTDRAVRLLGWLFLLGVPVFVVCAALGGYWLSRRALLPLVQIAERARIIEISNLSDRLSVPRTHDELQLLTETWNAMLGRLEGAVARISRFTADASHELRTPVAIMRLAAETALRRPRPAEEYRAALERIQGESENMTGLIEDLLFLARSDADASVTKALDYIDLGVLIGDVCRDFEPLAVASQHVFTQAVPTDPVSVIGDYAEIRRMLLILLDNAIKYTPPGGAVSVELQRRGRNAVLRVVDTGIGIPEAAQERVFQRFFRVDPSRNKESGGYGLGLAIARAIVERHNASIELETHASGGCVFSVSWPVAA